MSEKHPRSTRLADILVPFGIGILTFIVILTILALGVARDQYDIQIGHPASTTIYATRDVEDTVTTQQLRDSAMLQVEPTYKSVDHTVDAGVLADIRSAFSQLSVIKSDLGDSIITEQTLAAANEKSPFILTEDMLSTLQTITQEEFDAVSELCISKMQDALAAYLPEGQEDATVSRIQRDLTETGYNPAITDLCCGVLNVCVKPNMLIDTETTETNRQAASDSVQAVTLVNHEVIVREGEIVTEAEYQMISDLGLLSDNSFDFILYGGLAILDLLFCCLTAGYLLLFERQALHNWRQVMLLSVTVVFEMLLCYLLRSLNTYTIPIGLAAIVLCVLFNRRVAMVVATLSSFMVCLLVPTEYLFTATMFGTFLMALSSGPVAALAFSKRQLRSDILLSGIFIGIVNFGITMAVGMISGANMNSTVINALWTIAGGLFSAVLAIGLQALMETAFNLPTNARLIDLSNPNQKLLKRLLMEAPGTYHHSIIVANLAEAAASAVGGNGLLARVGAYYHDIGKLKRPLYYKENQIGENPHDHTDPRVSAAILTAHTRDGAQMAQKEHLPQPIVDIIRQHHGDTLAMYFYDKALKMYGENVDQSAFRYEGPRPRSIEAAVVMLADTIEAATRTLKDPTPEKMEAQIRKLVNAKLSDGQLNESPLTFADLDKICSTFVTVLTGVFHQRIEYPDIQIPPRETEAPLSPEPEERKTPEIHTDLQISAEETEKDEDSQENEEEVQLNGNRSDR